MAEIKLRPYQEYVVGAIREKWLEKDAFGNAKNQNILLEMATGAGKTYTFCYITDRIRRQRKRVYILVHRDNLLGQTMESLKSLGVPFRVIASGYTQVDASVQVCSVFTLANRLKDTPEPDLLIIDEAHHANAGSWRKILDYWPNVKVIGVTATPVRTDGSGLGKIGGGFFDCMVHGPTMRELIEMGNLCDYEYYRPPVGLDLSEVSISGSEFNKKQLRFAVEKPKITGCAIDHYLSICPDAPAIAFCVSIAHANDVAAKFRQRGINAQALTSEMDRAQIRAAIKALGEGRIQVLTSCDIISEGTDVPVVTAAILLRPTHSLGLFLQQVGRVLRPAPGKPHAIILDHVNNLKRHGLPDKKRVWSLDAKKKKLRKGSAVEMDESIIQTRQCEECWLIHKPQPTCPRCGYVYTSNRSLEEIDGTLTKVSREEKEAEREKKRIEKEARKEQKEIEEKKKRDEYWARRREQKHCETLEDFINLGKKRGYKSPHGWARQMIKARKKKST